MADVAAVGLEPTDAEVAEAWERVAGVQSLAHLYAVEATGLESSSPTSAG